MSNQTYSTTEQLLVLRGLTETTGALHEAQVFNLKMWGRLAAPHAKSVELAIEMDEKIVEFRLIEAKKAPKNLKDLLGGLDRSVKFLLGDKWKVVVVKGDKILFTGDRLAPLRDVNERS